MEKPEFKQTTVNSLLDLGSTKIESISVQDPNGNTLIRHCVRRPKAVAVVAEVAGCVLFIKQYRAAIDQEILELPAGKVDKKEQMFEASNRELIEETGYSAGWYELLTEYFVSPGYTDEVISIWLAHDVHYIGKNLQGAEEKHSEVVAIPVENINRMIFEKKIVDGKSLLGLQLALPLLQK